MTTLLQNRYELLEKIGDGGMATVYRARCTLLDRIVAVKILKEEYAKDSVLVQKFKSEAQAAARLSHPNIVNVYDVGEDNGFHFIVMEYVEGTNLKEYIREKGPLPPEEAVRIALMICDGLIRAHEKGLIHRDIKPHNILLTRDGTAKVADFGIARAANSVTITYSGDMVGSVHYVSPEQARGEPVNTTSDIYSLGCVLYEMVTGRVPFDADSPVTVALKHIHENPVPPSVINDAVPRGLEEVILTAMEKKPSYRYQSAKEMKLALSGALNAKKGRFFNKKKRADEKTLVMPPVGEEEDYGVARKRRRMKPMGWIIIAAVILGMATGLLYGMRGSLFGQEVQVPDVRGEHWETAREILEEKGLKLKVVNRIYSEVEKDHVISQRPEADDIVKKGREIEVVLSKGLEMVRVPNVVGETLENARFILENEGLKLGEVTQVNDSSTPEGVIVTQSPKRGTSIEVGQEVDVTVSSGTGQVTQLNMPNLIGMSLADARNKLQEDGLELYRIDQEASNEYFAGQVIRQSIPAGNRVEKGEKITVVVSTGPGPVAKIAEIRFTMPPSTDYSVLSIVVEDSKGRREIYNNAHLGGYTISRQVEYYGRATVTFYVDGEQVERQVLE
ncbi:MAG: Stk1 family PASTA domain-containing Ser/Thr kinase [Syntrophomonadaceae bacterium]|nr:Stk1 family PASTA domain-containing Ser/Thr kinase [Syntrophomonadaceae bacterium]